MAKKKAKKGGKKKKKKKASSKKKSLKKKAGKKAAGKKKPAKKKKKAGKKKKASRKSPHRLAKPRHLPRGGEGGGMATPPATSRRFRRQHFLHQARFVKQTISSFRPVPGKNFNKLLADPLVRARALALGRGHEGLPRADRGERREDRRVPASRRSRSPRRRRRRPPRRHPPPPRPLTCPGPRAPRDTWASSSSPPASCTS